MSKLKFKTNINCSGCVARVTPFLNGESGIEKWDVDTANPEKILTVDTSNLNSMEIIDVITNAGFKASEAK